MSDLEIVWAALATLTVVVVLLALTVAALARQIGILHERIAPLGALASSRGPAVGSMVEDTKFATLSGEMIGLRPPDGFSILLFFLSPTCPVCKQLLPTLKSLARSERDRLRVLLASDGDTSRHQAFVAEQKLTAFPYVLSKELGVSFRISQLPFAVLIQAGGTIAAKGLVNSREQLESLLEASERGHSSIQSFLSARHETAA